MALILGWIFVLVSRRPISGAHIFRILRYTVNKDIGILRKGYIVEEKSR